LAKEFFMQGTFLNLFGPKGLCFLALAGLWAGPSASRAAEERGTPVKLRVKHLKLKPGVKLFQRNIGKATIVTFLTLGKREEPLDGLKRGDFFQPIDTPEKAQELVQLAYPGHILVKNSTQYEAIVGAVTQLGWKPGKYLKADKPPSYGVTVTGDARRGYRVKMLLIFQWRRSGTLRDLSYYEFRVARNGRLSGKETVYITAPEPNPHEMPSAPPKVKGAPPWKQPLPAGTEAYDKALKAVLKSSRKETIPDFVVPPKK
jgi:hypothetical protein